MGFNLGFKGLVVQDSICICNPYVFGCMNFLLDNYFDDFVGMFLKLKNFHLLCSNLSVALAVKGTLNHQNSSKRFIPLLFVLLSFL